MVYARKDGGFYQQAIENLYRINAKLKVENAGLLEQNKKLQTQVKNLAEENNQYFDCIVQNDLEKIFNDYFEKI